MEDKNQTNNTNGESGAIVAVIVVVLLLAIGSFYFYSQRLAQQKQLMQTAATAEITNTSDNLDSIKNDLDSINMDNIATSASKL